MPPARPNGTTPRIARRQETFFSNRKKRIRPHLQNGKAKGAQGGGHHSAHMGGRALLNFHDVRGHSSEASGLIGRKPGGLNNILSPFRPSGNGGADRLFQGGALAPGALRHRTFPIGPSRLFADREGGSAPVFHVTTAPPSTNPGGPVPVYTYDDKDPSCGGNPTDVPGTACRTAGQKNMAGTRRAKQITYLYQFSRNKKTTPA